MPCIESTIIGWRCKSLLRSGLDGAMVPDGRFVKTASPLPEMIGCNTNSVSAFNSTAAGARTCKMSVVVRPAH